PARILVVGGDGAVRGSVAATLRASGSLVAEAADLGAVPPAAEGAPPIAMVVLLGDELAAAAAAARQTSELANLPIVAVMSPDRADEGEAVLAAGADEIFFGSADAALVAFVRALIRTADDRETARLARQCE